MIAARSAAIKDIVIIGSIVVLSVAFSAIAPSLWTGANPTSDRVERRLLAFYGPAWTARTLRSVAPLAGWMWAAIGIAVVEILDLDGPLVGAVGVAFLVLTFLAASTFFAARPTLFVPPRFRK